MAYSSTFLPSTTFLTSSLAPLGEISSLFSCSLISSQKSFRNFRQLKALNVPLVRKHNVLCMNSINGDIQVMEEIDYANTPYIPVYVMLPLDAVNDECELRDEVKLKWWMGKLKGAGVDGVMVECWWGIVERHEPEKYKWNGYKRLFQIVRELNLKLQVVMSFHACGGNVDDGVDIPLPRWVGKIGESNPDIFFTDNGGWYNPECLTWGIDNEKVLRGRTAVEVYSDYMESFRLNFKEFFNNGTISNIEVGLGPCGELRYPSYPKNHDWANPGIGGFQYLDKYLMKRLRMAAEEKGLFVDEIIPKRVDEIIPKRVGYDKYYGGFFFDWYSQVVIDHADIILSSAKLAFEGTSIAAKISGVHWYYQTFGHAAMLAAAYYRTYNLNGYDSIASVFKKHGATLNFTCVEMHASKPHVDAPSYQENLAQQVLDAAWAAGISVTAENTLPCYERDCYNKILENAKLMNDPMGRHLSAFTYLRLTPGHNLYEFSRFVNRMHGIHQSTFLHQEKHLINDLPAS